MARIRTIKPEFFTSGDIVELSPLARLLYIGLWCEADREGRFKWSAASLKMRYLPTDDCDIKALMTELKEAGLVIPYKVKDVFYAYIPSFLRHQVINNREQESCFPAPDEDELTRERRVKDASSDSQDESDEEDLTRERRVKVACKGKEGKEGRERKGKEGNKDARTRLVSLPENFGITDELREWAKEKGYSDLEARLEHFTGWAKASGKKYLDWTQAFQNAVRDDWAKIPHKPSNVVPIEPKAWICAHCGKPASRKQGNAYFCHDHDHTSWIQGVA